MQHYPDDHRGDSSGLGHGHDDVHSEDEMDDVAGPVEDVGVHGRNEDAHASGERTISNSQTVLQNRMRSNTQFLLFILMQARAPWRGNSAKESECFAG